MSIPITWNREDISKIWKERNVKSGTHRPQRARILKAHYNKFRNVPLDQIERFLEIQRNSKEKNQFTETYYAAEPDENAPNHSTQDNSVLPLQTHRSLTGKLLASNNAIRKLQQTNEQLRKELQSTQQQLCAQKHLLQRQTESHRNLQKSLSAARHNHRQNVKSIRDECTQKLNILKLEHKKTIQNMEANHHAALQEACRPVPKLSVDLDISSASVQSTTSTQSRMLFRLFPKCP